MRVCAAAALGHETTRSLRGRWEVTVDGWPVLVAAGLVGGTIAGTLGAGGAVFLIAALAFGVGLPMHTAGGIGLVNAFGISLTASIAHSRRRQIDLRTGLTAGGASVLGSGLGGWISGQTSDRTLATIYFVCLLLGLLMLMLPADALKPKKPITGLPVAGIGVSTGLIGGMVGLGGGGFILLPLLVRMAGLRMHVAVGTSLFIGLFGSLAALLGRLPTTPVPLLEACTVLVGSTIGTQIGTRLGGRLSPLVLRRTFTIGLTLIALRVAADLLGFMPRGA